MCGEKCVRKRNLRQHRGSPPRVRGEGVGRDRRQAPLGITPACAGRSSRPAGCCRPDWDHPRVCGEKPPPTARSSAAGGSPPRVRGEVQRPDTRPGRTGITPACAGRRDTSSPNASRPPDHPRVCGEKPRKCGERRRDPGSPPRVRGEGFFFTYILLPARITPACAGRRASAVTPCPASWDHPRVCGEKQALAPHPVVSPGSPPRVRGEVARIHKADGLRRITPACAGRSAIF